jgi:hypothetical protein
MREMSFINKHKLEGKKLPGRYPSTVHTAIKLFQELTTFTVKQSHYKPGQALRVPGD